MNSTAKTKVKTGLRVLRGEDSPIGPTDPTAYWRISATMRRQLFVAGRRSPEHHRGRTSEPRRPDERGWLSLSSSWACRTSLHWPRRNGNNCFQKQNCFEVTPPQEGVRRMVPSLPRLPGKVQLVFCRPDCEILTARRTRLRRAVRIWSQCLARDSHWDRSVSTSRSESPQRDRRGS